MLDFKQEVGDMAVLLGTNAYFVRTVKGKPSIVAWRTQDGTVHEALLPDRCLSERETRAILAHISHTNEQS